MVLIKERFIKDWDKKAKKINKNTKLEEHIVAVAVSFFLGLIIYALIYIFILPKSLPIPKTTAINWLVQHQHSIQLDYLRFVLFVLIVSACTIFGWMQLIWRKKG